MNSNYVSNLKLKLNPDYNHDLSPEENEFELWNPVSANNDLMKLSNAAIDISQECTVAMRARAKERAELRKCQSERQALERRLLAENPLTTNESKTLKTVNAAIYSRAWKDPDKLAAIERSEQREEELERRIEAWDDRITEWNVWLKTITQVSENIKTALSFYKDERKRAYA